MHRSESIPSTPNLMLINCTMQIFHFIHTFSIYAWAQNWIKHWTELQMSVHPSQGWIMLRLSLRPTGLYVPQPIYVGCDCGTLKRIAESELL